MVAPGGVNTDSLPRLRAWAQALGECFPLTHFLRLIRGIMLKGATYADVAQPIATLMLFVAIFGLLALSRFRQTLD